MTSRGIFDQYNLMTNILLLCRYFGDTLIGRYCAISNHRDFYSQHQNLTKKNENVLIYTILDAYFKPNAYFQNHGH